MSDTVWAFLELEDQPATALRGIAEIEASPWEDC